ncbi:alpha/beta fold hydrolase [Hoyosella altamirensis]|uniref:Pimeloyl-ACP methyl ester carboxylesterase n=1 Tax=Hoyosella altamirensis TaxID=616997 RepID=A0A839RMM0_9ACTN|nr:alpha/beta hydrolase [Hoyosella altamirensis]MBB3038182.1 pimeloyl-ACP methyl ester carboxylesterase [Hoyosella altamirensis]
MVRTPTTQTLDVPGAVLHYDIRGELPERDAADRVLLLAGSPMDASGFVTLASHFEERAVVTYDPRGTGRSRRTDGTGELTPETHADDLHRLIDELGAGPVDIFASSGGAVNALKLVTEHPDDVRTLVAHEPPLATVVPDSDVVLAVCEDIYRTYQRAGSGPAMAKFIALTGRKGELAPSYLDEPSPSAADFGLPTEDDGARDDPLVGQNLRGCCGYVPDFEALANHPAKIIVAAGEESRGEFAARAAAALAHRLGTELAVFPSHHAGFLGGEYGMTGEPEAFARTLRDVLAARL